MARTSPALAGTLLLLVATPALADVPVTLRGSPESMLRQNRVAKENNLDFYRTPAQVQAAIAQGELVPLDGNGDYWVKATANSVARYEVRQFIEQLSSEYRASCGEQLVVTSLTRPALRQPANAHPLSVHPAGMAIDLRVPQKTSCRRWLEGRLLELEDQGILDATLERTPPHYHVALFPHAFRAYRESLNPSPKLAVQQAGTPLITSEVEQPFPIVSGFLPASGSDPYAADERRRTRWVERLLTLPTRLLGLLRA
jgi:hypothetical protein